eukprot:1220592-Pleurochrysis_carterae.AAC.2
MNGIALWISALTSILCRSSRARTTRASALYCTAIYHTPIAPSLMPHSADQHGEFTWKFCKYDCDGEASDVAQELRVMKATIGQELMDNELRRVRLELEGDEPDTFVVDVWNTGEDIVPPDEVDEEDEPPTYPITTCMCSWEYKGCEVCGAYKNLPEEEAAERMKVQQAPVGSYIMDDCFGRVKLLSQPLGCELKVQFVSTGGERVRTAWHLYADDPEAAAVLDPEADADPVVEPAGRNETTGGSPADNNPQSNSGGAGTDEVDTGAHGDPAPANDVDDAASAAQAAERAKVRDMLVQSLDVEGARWGLDPGSTDIIFYRSLVLAQTMQTGMTYRNKDGAARIAPVVSAHHTVRSAATRHFLEVLGIFKPLAGFKVSEMSLETETVIVDADAPEHAYTLARQPRYFGASPGYFTGESCAVFLVWNKEIGRA